MSYKLNKSSIEFLFSHDLISQKYNHLCEKLYAELHEIQLWLDKHIIEIDNVQYYESYFHTLVHDQLDNLIILNERNIFYIDVGDMNKTDAGKILAENFKKFKKRYYGQQV